MREREGGKAEVKSDQSVLRLLARATRLDQGLHEHLARHRAVVHDQHVHVGEDGCGVDVKLRGGGRGRWVVWDVQME